MPFARRESRPGADERVHRHFTRFTPDAQGKAIGEKRAQHERMDPVRGGSRRDVISPSPVPSNPMSDTCHPILTPCDSSPMPPDSRWMPCNTTLMPCDSPRMP